MRSWLPDDIGGLVWFAYDNPAMLTYAPIYVGIEEVPIGNWAMISGANIQENSNCLLAYPISAFLSLKSYFLLP